MIAWTITGEDERVLLVQFRRLKDWQKSWVLGAMRNFIERDEEKAIKASEEFIPYSPQEADKFRSRSE